MDEGEEARFEDVDMDEVASLYGGFEAYEVGGIR